MPDTASIPVAIRFARPEDCDVIADFNSRLASESEGLRLDPQTIRAGVERVLADPARGRYYIAEVNGVVAGQTLITYEWSDWRDGWFWWIQSVYVLPDYRQSGVFRSLHNHIVDQARQQPDVRGLRLYVDARNERAMRTYERIGMDSTHYVLYETDWSGAIQSADASA